MSDPAYQALYAMLLGEPPYVRAGAPEPGLLLELVPVLPDSILAEAVWGVAGMSIIWPTQRQRLLAALLERAAEAGQVDLLAQAIVQIPEVVQVLPESLLPEALDAVRAFEWWDEPARATALALLAARAPEPSLQDVLAAARVPIDYGDRRRAPALAAAIAKLSGPLPDTTLDDLLDAARAMPEGNDRGTVLAGLLSRLDESAPKPAILEALAAFQADDQRSPERAGALAALSQRLPEPLKSQVLDQAVAEARGLAYGDEQARALVEVSRQVSEPLAGTLLLEIHSLDIAPVDLITLAPYLSEAQLERALEALPDQPVLLEGALDELAPHLPEPLLAAALGRGEQDESRLAVLQSLASHLTQALFAQGLDLLRSLAGRWAQEKALAALWPYLPDDLRRIAQRLQEAGIQIVPLSGQQIRELWSQLSPEQQLALAQDVIHATCGYYGGAEAAAPPPLEPEPAAPPFPREIEPPEGNEVWRGIDESPGDEGSLVPKGLPAEERLVNTGFSTPSRAGLPVDPGEPLAPAQMYYFWFQVGRRVTGAIDVEAVRLPTELLPIKARLTVALFAFEGELLLTPGQDVGEIQVQSDLSVRVVRPVDPSGAPDTLRPDDPLLGDRCLFFPIVTPDANRISTLRGASAPGLHRLRCNVYYQGVLVQSHLVQALVMAPGDWPRSAADAPALSTRCDYTLTNTLRPQVLTRLDPHRLSLMINDNGDGTHGFRFFARDEADAGDLRAVKYDSTFDGPKLQHLIDLARGAMRKVSWGDEEPWDWRKMYRYGGRLDQDRIEQLKGDLVQLARRGFSFYVAAIGELAAGDETDRHRIREQRKKLEDLMASPGGLIQIASKETARHIVPLALFYDYGLDPAAADESFDVCPEFLQALRQRKPLGETPCFQGACPSRDKLTVVCPSGFWGYRHGIGMPVSIGGKLDDAVTEIAFHDAPRMTMAVSTDERLKHRVEHESALRALRADVSWQYADTRDEALELMDTEPAQVVYFYCHGGVTEDDLPYIEVGQPETGRITSELMFARDLFWDQVQPLVFVNGCHTTALEPEVAFDLVQTFVETVGAAGVIGTEITIYEPLATAFGEACLKRFIDEMPIGEAVRQARLELLQQGNPLGLVYDAFAVASLKMVPAP